MEIAAVDHPIRAIHRARRRTKIEQLPGLASAVKPDLLSGRLAGDGFHLPFEIECDENARPIGTQSNTRPEFTQLGRLFENLDLDPSLDQRQSRDQTANSGSRDQNFRPLCIHSITPGFTTTFRQTEMRPIAYRSGNRR